MSRSGKSSNSPFIALNCGAITKELFGSELFGHVGGAFTGASRDGKPGVFELANGGVLSLDEIGEMPLDIQPFLLRVLEERVIHRLGDSRARPVDIRLVASTNRDLKNEVAAGRFRRDLYYRISTISIHVPPLRERGDDCCNWSSISIASWQTEKAVHRSISQEAQDALLGYSWPGNVRELRNMVERLHLLSIKGIVDVDDLPGEMTTAPARPVLVSAVAETTDEQSYSFEDAEREAIRIALIAEHGNLSKVAQRLGVSRPTLYRKLEHFGIKRGFV